MFNGSRLKERLVRMNCRVASALSGCSAITKDAIRTWLEVKVIAVDQMSEHVNKTNDRLRMTNLSSDFEDKVLSLTVCRAC